MNDFKVDDRVEYVGGSARMVTVDLIGTFGTVINGVTSSGDITVRWDNEKSKPSWVLPENLRLVTPAPDVLTIDRTELPEVVERDGALWAHGLQYGISMGANTHRAHALAQLAVSEFLATREKAEQNAADQHTAILNKRRDELANELFGYNYAFLNEATSKAINRIIELEGRAKK